MTSWQIEPGQARAIITQAETDAAGIETATRTLEPAIGKAIGAVRGGTQSSVATATAPRRAGLLARFGGASDTATTIAGIVEGAGRTLSLEPFWHVADPDDDESR